MPRFLLLLCAVPLTALLPACTSDDSGPEGGEAEGAEAAGAEGEGEGEGEGAGVGGEDLGGDDGDFPCTVQRKPECQPINDPPVIPYRPGQGCRDDARCQDETPGPPAIAPSASAETPTTACSRGPATNAPRIPRSAAMAP